MRVLVTRPEEAGLKTARRLQALGHEPVSFPLFRAHHEQLSDALILETVPCGIVFTSAEALRALGKCPSIAAHLSNAPVFAVGKATARAASEAGFTTVRIASGYGADLAELVKTHYEPGSGQLLYFAGDPRSPSLEAGLKAAGIPVRVIVAYRMQPVFHDDAVVAESIRGGAAILLYSREAAFRMTGLLERDGVPEGVRFYCLSSAIAAALPARWANRIRIAAETTEEALLSLLAAD